MAGWTPSAGLDGRKISSPPDSIPDRPAHSQSLYRLSYPAYCLYIYIHKVGALNGGSARRTASTCPHNERYRQTKIFAPSGIINHVSSVRANFEVISEHVVKNTTIHVKLDVMFLERNYMFRQIVAIIRFFSIRIN